MSFGEFFFSHVCCDLIEFVIVTILLSLFK